MNGRFSPIEDLSNAFSLLSPRPFNRQAQYSSVSTSSSSSQNVNLNSRATTELPKPRIFPDQSAPSNFYEPTFGRRTPIFDNAFSSIQQPTAFMDGRGNNFGGGRNSPSFGGRNSPLRMGPMMPEWGFIGTDSPRQRPFPDLDSPSRSNPSAMGRERIIPIRVEGGPSGNRPSPVTERRPLRPESPLAQPIATYAPVNKSRVEEPVSRQQHEPVSSSVFTNRREEPLYSSGGRKEEPFRKGEPIININLGQAPNLSSRLAGKTTSFDEFADVLSHMPNRPKQQNSLDEFVMNGGGSKPAYRESPLATGNSSKVTTPSSKPSADSTPSTPQQQSKVHFAPATVEAPNLVKMFDEILNGPLAEFVQLSGKIGGDVNELSNLTKCAFDAQRVFLWKACGMTKPNDEQLANLLKPISDKIEAIIMFKNSKRTSQVFNHISAIAEGIPALGWVTVSPTPAPYIKEMSDASQFYTNRVLKDYKEKEPIHAEWVKAWLQTLSEMQKYVKQNHTTGLVWNSTPGTAPTDISSSAKTKGPAPPPPPPMGVPPPPPPSGIPPPPPPPMISPNVAGGGSSQAADARAALFAEINKGLDITKGLKKVSDDQKTHKNPALRGEGPPPPKPPKPSHLTNGSSPSAGSPVPSGGSPKLELEGGKKWIVENFKDNRNVVVNVTDMKQVIYIYKCINAVIQVKGKVNSITIDGCKKTCVVFEDLVSCIEIINCQSMQIQTLGSMPTLAIQKTDGCQVYLSPKSLNAEIVTSKSSEMNILVPDERGEFREFPVPEQYKTVWTGRRLDTSVVDIA